MQTQGKRYLPEGMLSGTAENAEYLSGAAGLEKAMAAGKILEAPAILCDEELRLTVDLGGGMRGYIPREEVAYTPSGEVKEVAILSRVGKPICFKVREVLRDLRGMPYAILSRRDAMEECLRENLLRRTPGDILPARVTHLEPFGAFVDIGCGVISLLSIDCISVSRIQHPSNRFLPGGYIRVAIRSIDRESERICVTHKELLGSWAENAALFSPGQTVTGIIRSVEEYGVFVELTPNLAGLAEAREGLRPGQVAAVYIKSILPERMKIKLVIIDAYESGDAKAPLQTREPPEYFISDDIEHLDLWTYSPPGCGRRIVTDFRDTADNLTLKEA